MSIPPLARRLRIARNTRGLSTEEVAVKLELTPGAIRHHENGARVPTVPMLQLYTRVYHVSADWLLTGYGKGPSDPEDITDEALQTFKEIPTGQQRAAVDVLRALAGKKASGG